MAYYHFILHKFMTHGGEAVTDTEIWTLQQLFHLSLHLKLFVSSVMPLQHHHQGAVIKRWLGLKNMHILVPARCLSNIYYKQTDGHQEF